MNCSHIFFFTYWLTEATNEPGNTAARDSVVNSSSESGQNAVMTLLQYFSDCHAHARARTHTHTHTHTHTLFGSAVLRYIMCVCFHHQNQPRYNRSFGGETVCSKLTNFRWQCSCNSVGTGRKLRITSVPQETFLSIIVYNKCAERIPYRLP